MTGRRPGGNGTSFSRLTRRTSSLRRPEEGRHKPLHVQGRRRDYPEFAERQEEVKARKCDDHEAVGREKQPRLTITAPPPRSGKSEIVSRRFPAYFLGRFPDLSIISAAHAASPASKNNIIDDPVKDRSGA